MSNTIIGMADLTQEDWAAQLSKDTNAVILDVRTEAEVEEGYIPNAVHVDIHMGQGFIDAVKEMERSWKNFSPEKFSNQTKLFRRENYMERMSDAILNGFKEWQR